MNKIYLLLVKYSKALKDLVLSIIKYYNSLFQQKKTIDNMYTSITQRKKEEIKILEKELKIAQHKNVQLEKELLNIKNSLNEKNSIIENLQDLVTRRIN